MRLRKKKWQVYLCHDRKVVVSSLQYIILNTLLSNALKHLLIELINLKLKVLLFCSFVKTPCPLKS